jgi:hypothetical protein
LTACGESSSDKSESFSYTFVGIDEYSLKSFDLPLDVKYWEIRSENWPDPVESFQVYSFDLDIYDSLDSVLRDEISNIVSPLAFGGDCLPSACGYFGVFLIENSLELIQTPNEMLEFFGEINTPIELAIWLRYTELYRLESYEPIHGGYNAIVSWSSCSNRGTKKVFVDTNGIVTVLNDLTTEKLETTC